VGPLWTPVGEAIFSADRDGLSEALVGEFAPVAAVTIAAVVVSYFDMISFRLVLDGRVRPWPAQLVWCFHRGRVEMCRPSSLPSRRDLLEVAAAAGVLGCLGAVCAGSSGDRQTAVVRSIRTYRASADHAQRLPRNFAQFGVGTAGTRADIYEPLQNATEMGAFHGA
jgi:hypothetical protein